MDVQLELAARNSINADIDIDQQTNVVYLSSIFKWFEVDFGGRRGVVDFLVDHLPEGERKNWFIHNKAKDVSLKYKPYDWGLNSSQLELAE